MLDASLYQRGRATRWLVLSVTMIFARHVYIGYEQSGMAGGLVGQTGGLGSFYIALLAENITQVQEW
jgi:nitrate/nitrite transporter NarK